MRSLIMRVIIMCGLTSVLMCGSVAFNNLRSDEIELPDRIYIYLMNKILKTKLSARNLFGPKPRIPETNPYRRADHAKALAACLSYRSHRVGGIAVKGWWYSYNYNTAGKARRKAMYNCKYKYEKKRVCECFILDVNDTNYIDQDSEMLNVITE